MAGDRQRQRGRYGDVDGRVLRAFVIELSQTLISANRSDYELGGKLEDVFDKGYWKVWPTEDNAKFDTFEEWCWGILGFSLRKAEKLRQNWRELRALQPADDTLARCMRLGWTKLGHILRVARTELGLIKWLDHVESKRLSEIELRAEVQLALAGTSAKTGADRAAAPAGQVPAGPNPTDDDAGDGPGETVNTITPAPPQDGVVPTSDRAVKMTAVFEDPDSYKIVMKAAAVIQKRFGEMGLGRALALMATDYMGNVVRDEEGGAAVGFDYLVRAIEHTYGVRLKVDDGAPPPPPAPVVRAAPDRDAATEL